MNIAIPRKLNGFPVIAAAPRRSGGLSVIVDRGPDAYQRYVQAAWSPSMGTSWCWGHYCESYADAYAAMHARAEPAESVTPDAFNAGS